MRPWLLATLALLAGTATGAEVGIATLVEGNPIRRFVEAFDRTAGSTRATAAVAHANTGSSGASRATQVATMDSRQRSVQSQPLDDAFVDQVAKSLAIRIGPIARIARHALS